MKRLKYSILFALLFIFSHCSDNVTEITQNSEENVKKVVNVEHAWCANNVFAYLSYSNDEFSICWCQDGTPDVSITALQNGLLWANLVGNGVRLGSLACQISNRSFDDIPAVNNFQNITTSSNPRIRWEFKWSHYFLVQKKVGTGNWNTISQIQNKTGYPGDPQDYNFSYQDNSIDISIPHQEIKYRVINKLFDFETVSINEIVFPSTIALTANIIGPSEVLNPMKGQPPLTVTWNANISGGNTPYTYNWYYNGGLYNQHNNSFSLTFPYAANQRDSYFNIKLVVIDAHGVIKETTKRVFLDYPPYQP